MFTPTLLALALAAATEAPKQTLQMREKIEARVGQEIITSTDLSAALEARRAERPNEPESVAAPQALNALIDRILMRKFSADQGISVSDREVESRINSIRSMNGIQSEEQFRQLLEKQGLTFDRFKAQLRDQYEQAQFMQLMRRQIEPKLPKLGDAQGEQELIAYFKNNSQRYSKNLEIELQECIISFEKGPKEAEAIAKQFVDKPKTFDQCVSKWSSGPSKAQKGLLGKFTRGILREDVEGRVFGLQQGDVAMIRMPGGIQLLKLKKVKDLGPLKFEDVKEKVREELAAELTQKEIENTLADLKAKTYIKI